MSFQFELCSCVPLDFYMKNKDKIEPYKEYIKPCNFSFNSIGNFAKTEYTQSGSFLNLDIKISKNMISSIIEDKIAVYYEYPSKYGFMSGTSIITSYHNSHIIKIKDYMLIINKFYNLNISINYDFRSY